VTQNLAWVLAIGLILVLVAWELISQIRRPRPPTATEALRWTLVYAAAACAVGLSLIVWRGAEPAGQFFAGYLTAGALSFDNFVVFLAIMGSFSVPAKYRQRILLFGLVLALVVRGIFVVVGATAIQAYPWLFYLFGAFLAFTAISVVRDRADARGEYQENALMRRIRKAIPATDRHRGASLMVTRKGKRLVTPIFLAILAIVTADAAYALDSIPAVFGITRDPGIVFAVNAFALMGISHLLPLVHGLLARLRYFPYGLVAVLSFISVTMVLEALRANSVGFINGGEPLDTLPQIATWVSLSVIAGALAVAVGASIVVSRRRASVK